MRCVRRFNLADDTATILLDHHYFSERAASAASAAATTTVACGLERSRRPSRKVINGGSHSSCHARGWCSRWSVKTILRHPQSPRLVVSQPAIEHAGRELRRIGSSARADHAQAFHAQTSAYLDLEPRAGISMRRFPCCTPSTVRRPTGRSRCSTVLFVGCCRRAALSWARL